MTEQNAELMSDLQQFLYDARDQILLLENCRAQLGDLFDTSSAREDRLNKILHKIDSDVRTGVNIQIDIELRKTIKEVQAVQAQTTALQKTSTKALIATSSISAITAMILIASTIYVTL